MPPLTRPISKDQFVEVERVTKSLGFDSNFQPRGANIRHAWLDDPKFDTSIREVLPDFLEYVIPVEVVVDGPSGFPVSEFVSVPDAIAKTYSSMETARINFAQLVATNGGGVGRHDYAYLHGNLRATSRLRDGFLRTGFLAVCREGVALVGLQTQWEPQSYGNNVGSALEQLMPEGTLSYPYLRSYIRFDEIEDISTAEICRADGLVALLYVLNPRPWAINWMKAQFGENGQFIQELADVYMEISGEYGQDRSVSKFFDRDRPPTSRLKVFQLWDEVNALPSPIENLLTIAQRNGSNTSLLGSFARDWYANAVHYQIHNGLPCAGGPGYDLNGAFKATLFSSSLVLSIKSKDRGLSWSVQSNFSEIDAAVELLKHMCETTGSNQPNTTLVGGAEENQSRVESNTQLDLADQLERLVALHERGLLSDEEFLIAKRRLIQ